MSNELSRGVFDNNVLVSAALLGGVPRQAFDKLLDNGAVLVSVPVLLELADVLNRSKFDKYVTHDERMRFMVSFLKVAEMVESSDTFLSRCLLTLCLFIAVAPRQRRRWAAFLCS